ncbi:Carbamoyltransferase [uncultured Desulfatiglans sp.]|uniref:Carbamoyltransferase n=1 Tax=Uncultured Desulfatiglans sp. TaxID=1748965 RepID=A0A653A6C3_UNCDX|nr:Carbamoyltransferase [uncultured Desulfatiglans sp.]
MTYTLGIWDGHDAGAALVEGDRIVFAVNEERLSRRKLEVGFPFRSIRACLQYEGIEASAVGEIAVSTSDPAKTLTRLVPGLKEEYYLIRRRKMRPRGSDPFKKGFKYRFTELGPNLISRRLSRIHLRSRLEAEGFAGFRLSLLDHHRCHAEAAARTSGFERCLVLTLDGVGDGLSGSLWRFDGDGLHILQTLPSSVSLGIFFEHVTNLMNMRELEDEGKVMALANYAYPIPDRDNPLMALIEVRGLRLVSPYTSTEMHRELKKILWQYPSEQFAYMAQRVLEERALTLIQNAMRLTGERSLACAGGVFSNVKLNMKIARLPEAEEVFVFPHMGDGGLALGAAIGINYERHGVRGCRLRDLYLGPAFTEGEILRAIERCGFPYVKLDDAPGRAARLVLDGEIIFWFQGRMEIGPRALGNRSIVARPDRKEIKDRLNLVLKKRVWYQPFCPSILESDAEALLCVDGQDPGRNRFMTTAFRVREAHRALMEGVSNIDGTCRPHIVGDENPRYRDLLIRVKEELGMGVVLNTSLNIHGEPMVCSPDDALDMFRRTDVRHLFIGDFLVTKEKR